MILDSTAVVSVIRREQGHDRLLEAMEGADEIAIGAPTLTQAGALLVGRMDLLGRAVLSLFRERSGVVVIPFDDRHWRVAAEAFVRYGKGRHQAGLSFDDCLTYATARLAGAPLLSVGRDFPLTDLAIATA